MNFIAIKLKLYNFSQITWFNFEPSSQHLHLFHQQIRFDRSQLLEDHTSRKSWLYFMSFLDSPSVYRSIHGSRESPSRPPDPVREMSVFKPAVN